MATQVDTTVVVDMSASFTAQQSQGGGTTSSNANVTIANKCAPLSHASFVVVCRASDGLEHVIGSLSQPIWAYGDNQIPVRDQRHRSVTLQSLTALSYSLDADDYNAVANVTEAVGVATISLVDVMGETSTHTCVVGDYKAIGAPAYASSVPIAETAEIRVTFQPGSNLAVQFLIAGAIPTEE